MIFLIARLLVRGYDLRHACAVTLLPHGAIEYLIRLDSQGINGGVLECLLDPQSAVHGIYGGGYRRGGPTAKSQVN